MKIDPAVLKRSVEQLIPQMQAIHQHGGGEMRLLELAQLLNLPLDEKVNALLEKRGSMTFRATSPDGGEFENRGAKVEVSTPSVTIVFPALIAGTYQSTPASLEIRFGPATAIQGKKSFISAPMELLSMTPEKLTVKVGGVLGPMLSRTISFA